MAERALPFNWLLFLDPCWQILYHEDMRVELYDIKADIGEAHDLADVVSHATTVRELRVRPISHDSLKCSTFFVRHC
eukprot:COSAG02_NODE_5792_length_4032_cov_9.806763_4_plen_77_part_00